MKRLIIYIILIVSHNLVYGQVYLSGMLSNPVIESYLEKKEHVLQYKSEILEYAPIDIPILDNFSYSNVYPDSSIWIDREVYVNAHYPIYPVDFGVATFDVLDENGKLYPEASPFPFISDHLTSYPIKLGAYTPADSVYLSFYYQPQGRGDVPLPYDSLVLEFGLYNGDSIFSHYDSVYVYGYEYGLLPAGYFLPGTPIRPPGGSCDTNIITFISDTLFYADTLLIPCDSVFVYDTDWTHVWGTRGDTLENFLVNNDVYFKQVMIPIVDSLLFRDDFQFRFYNWGSLSAINSWQSNTDHWHIDKVYLNKDRTISDIYSEEVSFVEPGQSLISIYQSMPMWQYDLGKRDSFNIVINNLDSANRNCTYTYSVTDDYGNDYPGFNYEGYTGEIQPYVNKTISDFGPFVTAPVTTFFDYINEEEYNYFVEHKVVDADDPSRGDTLVYVQKFSNYFAYDDGTAERSYGGSATGTKIVVQFQVIEFDTLRGVQIFFNRTQNNNNNRFFHLGVWNDNVGEPGQQIYLEENLKPQFNGPNEFYTYALPDSITLKLGEGKFYVGVIQTTNDNLNIGFDRNTNTRAKTLYTTDGTNWIQSPFEGSLMIRLVMGKSIVESEPPTKKAPVNLTVYPNPTHNDKYVTITLPSHADDPKYEKYMTTRVFDLSGKLIYSAPYEDQLDVSWFRNGFYILNVFNSAFTEHYTTKLVIAK